MIHGPCGILNKTARCMQDEKWMKHLSKKFNEETIINEEQFPIYKRRDIRIIVCRQGVTLDNCFVIPYNKNLLMKYIAHANFEYYNQSRSVKYLFKYVNKSLDK